MTKNESTQKSLILNDRLKAAFYMIFNKEDQQVMELSKTDKFKFFFDTAETSSKAMIEIKKGINDLNEAMFELETKWREQQSFTKICIDGIAQAFTDEQANEFSKKYQPVILPEM